MVTNNDCNIATGANGTVLQGAGVGTAPTFTATPTVTSITINNAPVSGTDGTNKTYVDNAIAAVNPATSVVAATTAALTVTYNNGVVGIGATLTNAGTQAAFSIDGQSPTVGQRVLIKDQSSTFQNGVYTVTTVGSGITNWVLTRAVDYDQPSDINSTGVINVLNGTVNALTGWLINSSVTTVGTDPITYVLYNRAPITTTQYAVLVGAASNGIGNVGPSSSSGLPLISQGNAANPTFGTAVVGGGGTGATSFTAYSVIAAGATSTGAFQNVSGVGSSGQVLTSNGAGALPTWQTLPGAFVPTLTFITSTTASGGTVDFTSLSSTYKGFRFYLVALTPSATDIIIIRASTNNGSTYDSTSGHYEMTPSFSQTNGATQTQTGFPLVVNTNQTFALTGYVDAYFTTTNNAIVTFEAKVVGGSGNSSWQSGTYNVQANVNALRFTVVGANNLASGTIYQYGIS